jgi:hypothetical protein
MGRKKLPKPENTKYTFEEYRRLALDLYHNQGKTPGQIRAQLGTPFWDGQEWFIEFSKNDPSVFNRTRAEKKVGALNKRAKRSTFVDKDVQQWADRLTKEGKWPEGKSLDGFISAEKRLQTLLTKEIERLRGLGLDVSDGHIIALANENVRGTPLDKAGKGGSHSPRSRVAEMQSSNKARGSQYDIDKFTAREAGIPTTSSEAFAQYLTGDQGTGVHLTSKDKQAIHLQGADPNQVIAERYEYVERKKMEAWNKRLSGVVAYSQADSNYEAVKTPNRRVSNGNGNGNGNGVNGNGNGNGVNGKNGNGKANGTDLNYEEFLASKKNGNNLLTGIQGKFGNLRRVDQVTNIGLNAASGNVAGAALGTGLLAGSELLKNEKFQRRMATQISELVAKRGTKSALKLIPGLDVLISGKETWDYLQRGKLDQAGIALLSGAIGWIPVIGDGISASLDLTNTGLDIARMNYTGNDPKKKKNKLDTPTRRFKV